MFLVSGMAHPDGQLSNNQPDDAVIITTVQGEDDKRRHLFVPAFARACIQHAKLLKTQWESAAQY